MVFYNSQLIQINLTLAVKKAPHKVNLRFDWRQQYYINTPLYY